MGDDRVVLIEWLMPDALTHGSSAQRRRWFTTGLKEGKVSACYSFEAASL